LTSIAALASGDSALRLAALDDRDAASQRAAGSQQADVVRLITERMAAANTATGTAHSHDACQTSPGRFLTREGSPVVARRLADELHVVPIGEIPIPIA
jgi:hypothetical protein